MKRLEMIIDAALVILLLVLIGVLLMREKVTIVERPVEVVETEVIVIQEKIEYVEIIEEVIVYQEVEVPIEGTYTEEDMERVVDELVDILLAIADNEYQDIEFVYENGILYVFELFENGFHLTEFYTYEQLRDMLIN